MTGVQTCALPIFRTLFNRRNQDYVTGQERMWLQAELVQTVRRASRIYRETMSTPTSGPLPFALGYLRIRDGQVDPVSDTVPATLSPEQLARLLSEFVEPGAVLSFPDANETWRIEGIDALALLSSSVNQDAQEAQDAA